VVLAPTRWKLRGAIRIVNQKLATLEVAQHPDKTFIGRISRGFDFLGYRFQSRGLIGASRQTVERFVERATQLYERGADAERIGDYARNWVRWVQSGLCFVVDGDSLLISAITPWSGFRAALSFLVPTYHKTTMARAGATISPKAVCQLVNHMLSQ